MNKTLVIAVCAILLMLTGCEEYGVQLRIQNNSKFDFEDISVNNVSFGALSQNDKSHYLPFENIYEKEYVQVVINDKVLKLVPEEFDPTEFRTSGDYTYVIDILFDKYISLKFKTCLLYTSPSPRDRTRSRMPSSA